MAHALPGYSFGTFGTTRRCMSVVLVSLVNPSERYVMEIRNLTDMHHQHMGRWRFHYNESFHYFPKAALEVWHYLRVHRVKREPKYTLINFVEAAKALGNWVGVGP